MAVRWLLALVLLLATACALPPRAPVMPGFGFLYTRVGAPLQTDFDGTGFGSKKGEASANYLYVPPIFFIPFDIAWDSAAVKKAAENGGITTIHHADYEMLSVLGMYQRFTVYVYGD